MGMDPPGLGEEHWEKALVEQQPQGMVFCGLNLQFCDRAGFGIWMKSAETSQPGLSGWIETAPFALFILIIMAIKTKKFS